MFSVLRNVTSIALSLLCRPKSHIQRKSYKATCILPGNFTVFACVIRMASVICDTVCYGTLLEEGASSRFEATSVITGLAQTASSPPSSQRRRDRTGKSYDLNWMEWSSVGSD